VQALNLMAVLNPGVTHTMIDGALFQEEVERRQIMAVPTIFLNGEVRRRTHEHRGDRRQARYRRRRARRREAQRQGRLDVLVVGGGPAGAAAAIYAARKGIRTGLLAERFGGQVMDTLAIENFISVKETEGPKLVAGTGRTRQGLRRRHHEPAARHASWCRRAT
jgi:alkyl hydroperoxide reductase subunit F